MGINGLSSIITMSLPVGDFIENVAKKIGNLTGHFVISKFKSQYLRSSKEFLGEYEEIVLLNFAESYQLVI